MSSSPELPKRQKILKAAEKLFLKKGFRAVSMDEIARAAPVSKPTLYAHFKNKEELFASVVAGRAANFLASIQLDESIEASPREVLNEFSRKFLRLTLSPEVIRFYRTMIAESIDFPEVAAYFYTCGPAHAHQKLEQYFKAMHDKKLLRVDDADMAAQLFIGTLKGKMHLKTLLGVEKAVKEQECNRLAEAAVDMFIRAHRPD